MGYYKPSHRSNIALLLILAGNIETNPGYNNQCKICAKFVRKNDRALQCDDCNRWVHARCAAISKKEYENLMADENEWYCPNCVADCGLCSRPVFNSHKAVECDQCHLWIHTDCSQIKEEEYLDIQSTACNWICPKCDVLNFSDSFFDTGSQS